MSKESSYAELHAGVELSPEYLTLFKHIVEHRLDRLIHRIDSSRWDASVNANATKQALEEKAKLLEDFCDGCINRQSSWKWEHFSEAMALLSLPIATAHFNGLKKAHEFYHRELDGDNNHEGAEAAFLKWHEVLAAMAIKETFSLCLGFQEYERSGQVHGEYAQQLFLENQERLALHRDELKKTLGVPDGIPHERTKDARNFLLEKERLQIARTYVELSLKSYDTLLRDEDPELPPTFRKFSMALEGNEQMLGSHHWLFHQSMSALYDLTRDEDKPAAATMSGKFMVQGLCERSLRRVIDTQRDEVVARHA